MATKRFLKPAANWAFIAERVPETQKAEYIAFKSKADGFFRKVAALPEEPPKIDWSFYKTKIPIAGLVDSFQKQYDAYKVPYPANNYTDVYNQEEQKVLESVNEYVAKANAAIREEEENLKKWDNIPPFENMTLQEFAEHFPDEALNPIDKPTLWPHREEDQVTEEDEIAYQKKLAGHSDH